MNGNLISSFGTPASGINGASVTEYPLVIGSVSPALSTVSVNSDSAPADGTTAVQVTVTLRDINSNPVAGKTVNITSSRGGADAITPASATTDQNGQATAQITSLQPGTASITAVDATDSVPLQQQATVTFSSGGTLADEIRRLQVATGALLTDSTDSESLASTLARLTDYNDSLQQETTTAELDIAKATIDAAQTLADRGSKKKDVSGDAETLGLPGIKNQKLTHILTFVHNSDDNTGPFAQQLLTALENGSAESLTKPVLLQGFENYGTSVVKEYAKDQIESAILDQVTQRLGQTGALRDVFLPAAQTDLSQLQHDVNTTAIQTLNGLPALNDTLQSSWRANLVARAQANIAQAFYEIDQANTVEALKNSATQSSANPALEALLRTTGQALACGAFHALGCKLYGLALDGIDGGLAVDSLKTAATGSSDAILGFNGTINAATNIDQNVVNGLDAIHDYPYTPLDTPKGTISDIGGDTSNQHCWAWHAICTENASGSVLTVKNTGDVKAEFIVSAQYLTYGGAFGMATLDELNTNSAVIQPGQTTQIHISYKNGSTGSSPEDGTLVSFDLLAVNDTGTYWLGQTSTLWGPQPAYSSDARIAGAAAVASTVTSSAPAPDLVSSFVVGNAATTSDDEQIWINNPLTETVTAVVTQTVPTGFTVAQIGAGGTQQGSGTITWTATVPARTSRPVTMTLRLADPTAGVQILPAASADLIDAEGHDSGPVATDPITITPLQTLQVESGMPGQIAPGTAATIPYTITNVSGTPTSATFVMTLTDNAGNTVFTAQQAVAAATAAPAVISVTLPPTLPIGLLQEDARITGAGIWPATTTNSVLIGDSSPSLDISGPPSPSLTNSPLGYTLTVTNTTGQPMTDLTVTATVDGPGTIDANSVSDGGSVQGNTVTWDVPGSIAPGAVVMETLPVQGGADSSQAGSVHVQVQESTNDTLPQTVDAWTVLSAALTPPPSATGTASPNPSQTPALPAPTTTGTPVTPTPTGTATPSPSASSTSVPSTDTATPTDTPTPSATPTSTSTPTLSATATPSNTIVPPAPPAATTRPLTAAAPTNTVGPATRQATVTIRPPSPHATPAFRPRPRPTVTRTAGVPAPCVRPQITRLLVGGKPFKAGMPVTSGRWVRVTVHAAPHTHVRMAMTLTGTRVVLVGRGARRKRITRVVTVEQLAVEVVTNGHGDATGDTRIVYAPAQTEAVALTVAAHGDCGDAATTKPLALRLQTACVTPMVSMHLPDGASLRDGPSMPSGQTVVVDVDAAVNTRVTLTAWMYPLYAHGKRGPARQITVTRATGRLDGHATWVIRLLTVSRGQEPVLLSVQARVRCPVGKPHDVSVTSGSRPI